MRIRPFHWLWIAATLLGCSTPQPPAVNPVPGPATGDTSSQPVRTPASTQVSFKGDVVPFLKAGCASCHTQGNTAPAMFDAQGNPDYKTIHDAGQNIVDACKAKTMPPYEPDAVSPDTLQMLQAWVAAGAPNN